MPKEKAISRNKFIYVIIVKYKSKSRVTKIIFVALDSFNIILKAPVVEWIRQLSSKQF